MIPSAEASSDKASNVMAVKRERTAGEREPGAGSESSEGAAEPSDKVVKREHSYTLFFFPRPARARQQVARRTVPRVVLLLKLPLLAVPRAVLVKQASQRPSQEIMSVPMSSPDREDGFPQYTHTARERSSLRQRWCMH